MPAWAQASAFVFAGPAPAASCKPAPVSSGEMTSRRAGLLHLTFIYFGGRGKMPIRTTRPLTYWSAVCGIWRSRSRRRWPAVVLARYSCGGLVTYGSCG